MQNLGKRKRGTGKNNPTNLTLNISPESIIETQPPLSDEVWLIILSYLNFPDLLSVSKAKKRLHVLASDNVLWQKLLNLYFPEALQNTSKETNKNYKNIFIKAYNQCDNRLLSWRAAAINNNPSLVVFNNSSYHLADFHPCKLGKKNLEKSIIQLASSKKNQDFLNFLYSEVILKLRRDLKIEDIDETGRNQTHWMALSNQLEEFAKLPKKIKKLALVTDNGKMTALHSAAHCSHVDFLSLIVNSVTSEQLKAALRLRNNYCAILHLAIESGDTETVELLYKLLPGSERSNQIPPLHFAIECQQNEISKYLLEKGENPQLNSRIYSNCTALDLAVKTDNTELATLLLEKGVNFLEMKNSVQNCTRDMATLLFDKLGKTIELAIPLLLEAAINQGNLALFELLLEKRVIHSRMILRAGWNPLQLAIVMWTCGDKKTHPIRKSIIEKILQMKIALPEHYDRNKIIHFAQERFDIQKGKIATKDQEEIFALLTKYTSQDSVPQPYLSVEKNNSKEITGNKRKFSEPTDQLEAELPKNDPWQQPWSPISIPSIGWSLLNSTISSIEEDAPNIILTHKENSVKEVKLTDEPLTEDALFQSTEIVIEKPCKDIELLKTPVPSEKKPFELLKFLQAKKIRPATAAEVACQDYKNYKNNSKFFKAKATLQKKPATKDPNYYADNKLKNK